MKKSTSLVVSIIFILIFQLIYAPRTRAFLPAAAAILAPDVVGAAVVGLGLLGGAAYTAYMAKGPRAGTSTASSGTVSSPVWIATKFAYYQGKDLIVGKLGKLSATFSSFIDWIKNNKSSAPQLAAAIDAVTPVSPGAWPIWPNRPQAGQVIYSREYSQWVQVENGNEWQTTQFCYLPATVASFPDTPNDSSNIWNMGIQLIILENTHAAGGCGGGAIRYIEHWFDTRPYTGTPPIQEILDEADVAPILANPAYENELANVWGAMNSAGQVAINDPGIVSFEEKKQLIAGQIAADASNLAADTQTLADSTDDPMIDLAAQQAAIDAAKEQQIADDKVEEITPSIAGVTRHTIDLLPLRNITNSILSKFPFAIANYMLSSFQNLSVEPVAPSFELPLPLGGYFKFDLSICNNFASMLRSVMALFFHSAVLFGIYRRLT